MQIHKLDRAKDETELLVGAGQQRYPPKTAASLLLCYRCGAARRGKETVREIEIPPYVETDAPLVSAVPKPALFEDGVPDDDLLGYGVPAEWLDDICRATDDTVFDLAEHLPGVADESLLELATGGTP